SSKCPVAGFIRRYATNCGGERRQAIRRANRFSNVRFSKAPAIKPIVVNRYGSYNVFIKIKEAKPQAAMAMRVCKRVLYWGRVQGVGFRYTAQRLAQGFAVAGFVRNLRDGQVELVAEGEAADVSGLLEAVSKRMADYIQGNTIQDEPAQNLNDFEI